MKTIWAILFFITMGSKSCATISNNEIPKPIVKERMKRFSIFSLVQFKNSQCTLAMSTASNMMKGTCFTASECAANGGTSSGNCASGFGVCCMFRVSACGSTISKNCTYIQNPGFPTAFTSAGTCTYTFQSTADVCQIRLDLDVMTLANPAVTGNVNDGPTGSSCTVDTFKAISGTSTAASTPPNPPTLCGVLDGSHMYLETGRLGSAGSITIVTGPGAAGATPTARSWKVKVTFIECGNPGIAPSDCLQYFTETSGSFTSFNFQSGAGLFTAGQNYNVCFRQAEGFCSLALRQDSSIFTSFVLDQPAGGPPLPLTSIRACANAWVMIPTSIVTGIAASNSETYCGGYLNQIASQTAPGTVIANVSPWSVGVFSTSVTAIGTPNVFIGFKLLFQQNPCA